MPRENIIPFILQVVLIWAVAAAIVSGAVAGNVWVIRQVYFPPEDPEEFSGRAQAVVSERWSRGGGGPNPPMVRVYVDYTAGEVSVSGAVLRGNDSIGYREGDTLTVAYHPDSPETPFTLRTLERPGPVVNALTVVCALFFGVLAVVIAIGWADEVSDVRERWWMHRLPSGYGNGDRHGS